jgi:hypothetical protein
VASQRKRLEKALRGCAEAGVPDTMDLWPAVNERMTGGRVSAESVGQGVSNADPRRRARLPHLFPNTPLGWVLAAISVLVLGFGVYAAAEPMREFYRQRLPGTVEPGSKETDRGAQPGDALPALRTELDRTLTADGAKLTLDWAYADERYIVVGLHTQRLEGPRGAERTDLESTVLEPALWDDTVGNEAELPPYMKVTDESGQDFDTVGGGTLLGPRRTGAEAVFDAPEGVEPGRGHRFRLEVPLQQGPALSGKPEAGPFVFDFEVPVQPAPAIELNQKVEADGVSLTLKRVVDSPILPQAVVCFEPPDDEHRWTPWLEYDESYEEGVGSAPQKLGDGCWSLMMAAPVEGRTSVTVTNLEGMPRGGPPAGATSFDPKTIRGPWTFEFDAPAR